MKNVCSSPPWLSLQVLVWRAVPVRKSRLRARETGARSALVFQRYVRRLWHPHQQLWQSSQALHRRHNLFVARSDRPKEGVLGEVFTYSDDKTDWRIRKLQRQSDGSYTGTAGDVLNEAIS